MAGLLDFFGNGWEDPKSNAIMALAGGLLDGDFASGMKGYGQVMAGAGDAKLKRAMQQAQIDNYNSEILDRTNKALKQERLIKATEKFYGGNDNNGTGVGEVPFPTGGMSTPYGAVGAPLQMPQGMNPRQAGLAGKTIEEVLGFMNEGGSDKTLDAYKWVKDPLKLEQGASYQDRVTGKTTFNPKVGEGIMPNAQGVYGYAPGYSDALVKFEADKAREVERAKNNFNFREVTVPGGGTTLESNTGIADRLGGGQPQPQPMPVPMGQPQANKTPWISPEKQSGILEILNKELRNPRNTPEDIAGIQREIARAGGGQSPSLAPTSLAPNQSPQFGGGFGSDRPSLAPPPQSTVQPAPTGGFQLQGQQEKDKNKIVNENVGKVNDVFLKSVYTPLIESKGATSATIDSINQTRASMAAMGGTGWGTETKATAAAVLTGLGINGKNAEMYATNAQTFQQAAMTRLQAELQQQKGIQTEGDSTRQQATYASLKNTPQANAYILDSAQAQAERNLMKARFYESALPVASKKGDLQEIDREWNKRAPSLFSMPSMQKWAKK